MSPTAITPDQFSTFGDLLRHLRRQARITQRELAIAVGYSDTQISRIEQNQRIPDSATLTALFVPALYIEDEPKWVARLLELAKAAQVHGVSEMEYTAEIPTGTVTFLFTDIEGSTKLAQQHPDAMPVLLARHHEILNQSIQAHNGYVFQVVGDSFCAAFHSANDALNAALDSQRLLHNEAWSPAPIKVRMGIHTGAAQLQDASKAFRYSGYATIALTQRVTSAGHGRQVLVSGATENLLREQLPNDVTLRDLGKHNFKDVQQPVRVFQVVAPDLQSEFPALHALDVFANNLPTQITSFIGRGKEMEDVKKLLHDAHLLTLTGPGGTGKTRLSIQAAGEVLDQYPNGVWFVELAPILDPLLVPRTTAIAIGLRDEPQRPVIDMLCDYLREKKMLIILDNCEHLVDACAQMADRLLHTASSSRILASSREALSIAGEVTYQVPSLGLPDLEHLPSVESLSQYEAVKLFIDRAIAAVSTFTVTNDNAPSLAQICHRLDGIPLAIELAAAKIRVLSPDQIAKRLDDRFRLLTGGSRTALERHQTLRAALDWSYNLLSPAEQTLFRRLSIFVGGWTLEAAESVCSDPSTSASTGSGSVISEDVLDLLEQLIKKSLAFREEIGHESRYRMLETMRQYADEKLGEASERDGLRDRHLDYFLQFAETAAPHLIRPEQLEWLAQLDADYENLRFALEWALSKEAAESSLRLCAALGRFWYLRSYWLEGSKWMQSALSKPTQYPSAAEKAARVRALYLDAELAYQLDDVKRLRTSAELSLALAEAGTNHRDIAIARAQLGGAMERSGDYEYARLLMEQSLVEFRELNEAYREAWTYRNLIYVLQSLEKINYSEWTRKSLELARNAGERLNLAKALVDYADSLYSSGQISEAKSYLEEADMLFKQIGSNMSRAPYWFAEIARLHGDYETARSLYTEMQERFRVLGGKYFGSWAIVSLGELAMEEGNLDQAQTYLEEALTIARELEYHTSMMYRLAILGNILHLQGNIEEAKQNFIEGIRLAQGGGDYPKARFLIFMLYSISIENPENSARLNGVIDNSRREMEHLLEPLMKHIYYDRAETHACKVLGDVAFESAFAQGQKMSLDEALDLALKTVEEM